MERAAYAWAVMTPRRYRDAIEPPIAVFTSKNKLAEWLRKNGYDAGSDIMVYRYYSYRGSMDYKFVTLASILNNY